MLEEVRAAWPVRASTRFRPRRPAIPMLWMYGSDDRNVPTKLCLERLEGLEPSARLQRGVLPTTHTPLILPTGLFSSLPQSPGFDRRFFPALGDWLRRHGLG